MVSQTDNIHEPQSVGLLTVPVAARWLALSRSTLYNLMDRGDLAYVKIGRSRRIPVAEIDRLIRVSLIARADPLAA